MAEENPTPAQLAAMMSDLIDRWRQYTDQMKAWLGGTSDGGPNGDGRYPLTDALGTTSMILCPAGQEAQVTDTVDGTSADVAAAELAVAEAELAAARAETAAAEAQTYVVTTQDARDVAGLYADRAGSDASTTSAMYRAMSQVRLDTDGGTFADNYNSLMNHIDGGHVSDVYAPDAVVFDGGLL